MIDAINIFQIPQIQLHPYVAAIILFSLCLAPLEARGHFLNGTISSDGYKSTLGICSILLFMTCILSLFVPWVFLGLFSAEPGIIGIILRIVAILILISVATVVSPFILPVIYSFLLGLGVSIGLSSRHDDFSLSFRNLTIDIAIITVRNIGVVFVTVFNDSDKFESNAFIDSINNLSNNLQTKRFKYSSGAIWGMFGGIILAFHTISTNFYSIVIAPLAYLSFINTPAVLNTLVICIIIGLIYAGCISQPVQYSPPKQSQPQQKTASTLSNTSNKSQSEKFRTNEYGEIVTEEE